MKKHFFLALRVLFGVILLGLLIKKVELNRITAIISEIDIYLFIAALMVYYANFVIGGFNLFLLLNPLKKNIGFIDAAKYYMTSWSIGLCIPGKIGEFSIIYFLQKHNITIGEGFIITIIDKLFSVLILILMASFGLFLFFDKIISIKIILLLIFLIAVFIVVIISNSGRRLIRKYILRKYAALFKGFSRTLFKYLKKEKKILLVVLLLTILKLVVASWGISLFFRSLGIYASVYNIILITSIITIISLIPISISGLGLREVSAAYLYPLIGINQNVTISAYLIILVINYLTALYFIAFVKGPGISEI